MIKRPSGMIQTSVLISQEFYKLCKENFIKFTEALKVGISVMLAEKGILNYDNNLNIYRKMLSFQKAAEEALQKITELKEKNA